MRTILFTGSNGFLGKNIIPLLQKQYKVITLDIVHADITANLSNKIPNIEEKIDIVLHAAGKAHIVPKTTSEKQDFFNINYQGTVNLCKGLEQTSIPSSFIFISTVAVYGCETGIDITEEHSLEGDTPYALSKIQAESYLTEWCKKNNVKLSILRPSLIAGPNPPGNLGAMIKGIKSGRYFRIAGGKARKSVLMVQDIANLIPLLERKNGIYNICDDKNPSFAELEWLIASRLNKKIINIPYGIAKIFAIFGNLLGKKAPINSSKLEKITQSLTFSNKKAKQELGWKPLNVLENFKIE